MKSFLLFVSFQIKETYREPAILFWAFLFPVLLSGSLGLAFGSEKETITNAGWLAKDREPPISESIHWIRVSEEDKTRKIQRGEISLLVNVSPNGQYTIQFDPTNREAAFAGAKLEADLLKKELKASPVIIEKIITPGSRYIDFLIPGMIAFAIMNSCLWGIGSGLIEMRTKKLLVRYYATPFPQVYFFLSFFVVRILNLVVEILALYLFSYYLFDVRFTGSLLGLFMILFSGLFAFGGISILISSRTAKTQIGYGLINAMTFPMMIFSGIFFSNQGFPEWSQGIIHILPLTILADSIRSLFLEGFGITDILQPFLILIGVGLITLAWGKAWFKWIGD